MRKYGKFERMPDGTRAKQPKVKNVLLQTYFTSLLCMVLCVSMFFGTSYAWFTSEVNNVGNEIYIGTLKAGLDKNVGTDGWKSLSDKIDGVNVTNLFDKNIRWEPGYTSLETIRVTNMGDLAFKYTLYFTDGQIANDTQSDLAAVAGNFDVWIFDHHANKEKTEAVSNPASYDQITEANGWTPIGTLADVLNGKAVLENKVMETVRKHDSNTDADTPNSTDDGVMTIDTYTIALHMNEGATSEVMGKKIVLNVKLIAYQMGHEEDAFGNTAYDDAKFVTTAKELQAALDNATNNTVIRFANDITGDVTVNQNINAKLLIDGDGKTLNGSINIKAKSETDGTGSVTIKNIHFRTTDTERDFIHSVEDNHYPLNVTISGCSFEGVGAASDVVGIRMKSAKNLVIKNCTAKNVHSILQNVSGWNLTVQGVTVTEAGRGMSLGTVQDVNLSNVNVDVQKYGVRMDAGYNNNAVFTNCNIKAFIPVVVRNVSVDSNLTFNGANTMEGTNTDNLWCAIGASEYEANGIEPTNAIKTVTVTLNDTGLNVAGLCNNSGKP